MCHGTKLLVTSQNFKYAAAILLISQQVFNEAGLLIKHPGSATERLYFVPNKSELNEFMSVELEMCIYDGHHYINVFLGSIMSETPNIPCTTQ